MDLFILFVVLTAVCSWSARAGSLPLLAPGTSVVMDNASFHLGVVRTELDRMCAADGRGVKIAFLPVSSPELNPIESIFGIVKRRYGSPLLPLLVTALLTNFVSWWFGLSQVPQDACPSQSTGC